jgi:eukaryotic-like serine/threonine-protein kinase
MDRVADYELVRSLGRGDHGEFFLAKTPPRLRTDDEHVALKLLSTPDIDDAVRRMTRELRAFAAVSSPYLVAVLDAGQEGDRLFYAVAFHPMGSLEAPEVPLDRPTTLRAVVHAARGAHALHEGGLAHRGIKPSNVMLHEHGARLADLGLAEVLAPDAHVTGIGATGAVEFMDPEILRGRSASRASDIWSLGATLHRALTGEGIYGELPAQPLRAMRAVFERQPRLSDQLAPDERTVVEAALDPDPAQRPSTALALADMVDALGAAADG